MNQEVTKQAAYALLAADTRLCHIPEQIANANINECAHRCVRLLGLAMRCP